jgi:hypothetical protein
MATVFGILLCAIAVLTEIAAFVAWIYILIRAFREYELWIGIVSLLTPFFIYVGFDAFEGTERGVLLGLSVASHAFTLPMFLGGLALIAGS